jgi:putative transposase
MRYRAVQHQQQYPVEALCRALAVSRSGYYAWRVRQPSRRQSENQVLLTAIRRIHDGVKQRYGSPRVHRELLAAGGGDFNRKPPFTITL